MSAGFVYLRSLRVILASSNGPFETAATEAWGALFSWLQQHDLKRDVRTGYGICIPQGNAVRYEACCELPSAGEGDAAKQMLSRMLPGGAYARRRFVGPSADVPKAVAAMQDSLSATGDLVADPARPWICVYLDASRIMNGTEQRLDLLVPVTAGRLPRDKLRAA